MQRRVRIGAGISALACAAAMAVGAAAESTQVQDMRKEGFRPMVRDMNAGLPDSGSLSRALFQDRTVFDEPSPVPMHPPIDQIPAMPMPEPIQAPGIQPVFPDDRAIFHDAITGETQLLEHQMLSGQDFGRSVEGDYFGGSSMIPNEGPAGFGTMSAASGLDSWPRSGNVKLVMRFTDQNAVQRWFVCSGSMQDPGVVLTAAHCVYARSPNGINIFDWADIVYVYPGWDGNANNGQFGAPDSDEVIQNFGYAFGSAYIAGSDYVNNGNWDRDCGLIRLTRGSSRNIGMLTGWFAWAWGGNCASIQSRTYNNFSYPAENCPTAGLHNGSTMYYWNGTIDNCPGNQMELSTGGNCLDTVWGGMSGSGMYYIENDNRYIHAVCSTSNRNDIGRYCKLWEQWVLDMQDFESTTRGTAEDWEPLRMRARGSTTVQAGTAMNDSFDVAMVNATNANPALQDYTLRVYLSTNNNISTGDTLLATWNWNDRDWGAMANVNHVVPAPFIPIDTPPGNYWIGVIAESGLPGTDTNDDTDTWDAQMITVTEGLPGLATIVSPGNGSSNVDNNANIDWGSAARADSYDVYFGTDSTPDVGEFVGNTSATAWSLGTLAYNTTYYWRVNPRNTAGVTTGTVWSFTTEIEPLPDLNATQCEYDAGMAYYPGQSVSVTHRTYNDGGLVTPGVHLDFYLSTNNFISVSDVLIDTRDYGVLNPGGSHWFISNISIPSSVTPGTYYLGFIAEDQDGLDSNTGNNWVAGVSPIRILFCAPDLNLDGSVDIFDVFEFIDLFNNNDPAADFTGDSVIDVFDVFEFIDVYNAGCP